ncbi:MAG: solute carrier family 23 protein [Planctomycetota bacterium]
MAERTVVYGLEDRPPAGRAVVLALQHALTMFGATVAVPLLLGPKMGMDQSEIATLISSVMLCSGIATLIQATFGSRLPIIQGVSFSFLAAFFAIISAGKVEGWAPAEMMQYIAGTIMVGALVEMTIGFSGLMGLLRKVLSPVVVGPVIMLIGLALFQHGAPKAGTHWPTSGLTIVLVIIFSMILSRRVRFLKTFPILTAIVLTCGVCWVLSVTGVFAEGHPARIDFGRVQHSEWVRANPAEIVFPWGMPKFNLGFIIAGLAAYLASMIESFGDYHACSNMAGGGDPTPSQISRGIGCEGVGCFLTSVFGGFSSTSYSENIGLVGLTKVGSRYVVQIAGVVLVLLGLFGKFGALAATIPGPVVGGLYCVLFGLISAIGIQQLAKADLSSDRNLFIAGFSLFMGLSVPAYFGGLSSYTPGWAELSKDLPAGVTSLLGSIGSTGMGVAAILGIVLDNLIPGTPEERGLLR